LRGDEQMKKITVRAESVEDALEKAKKAYDLRDGEFEYKVLEKGFKGFLGLFAKEAEVEITFKKKFYERKIGEFIREILSFAGSVEKIDVKGNGKTYFVSIDGEDVGKLIGKHGKTLAALQHIVTIYANRLSDVKLNVVIDAGDYRERRKKQLEIIAKEAVKKALETKGRVELDPMFPFERRIIHEIVKRYKGVTSYSIGMEPYRRVVIEYMKREAKTRR